jgi:hypothetical protein
MQQRKPGAAPRALPRGGFFTEQRVANTRPYALACPDGGAPLSACSVDEWTDAAALFAQTRPRAAGHGDVGRHNALDKLVEWALGEPPGYEHNVLVTGRSSYEILQKCVAAGLFVVCAVSAPSTLAVPLAPESAGR